MGKIIDPQQWIRKSCLLLEWNTHKQFKSLWNSIFSNGTCLHCCDKDSCYCNFLPWKGTYGKITFSVSLLTWLRNCLIRNDCCYRKTANNCFKILLKSCARLVFMLTFAGAMLFMRFYELLAFIHLSLFRLKLSFMSAQDYKWWSNVTYLIAWHPALKFNPPVSITVLSLAFNKQA